MEIYLTNNELENAVLELIEYHTPFTPLKANLEMVPPSYDWLTLIAHHSVDMDDWNEEDVSVNEIQFLEDFKIRKNEEKISLNKSMLAHAIFRYIHYIGLCVDNIVIDLSNEEVQRYFKVVIYSEEPAPTEEELLADACMWYRHDFGLLSKEEQDKLMFQAKEWKLALTKAGACQDVPF